MKEHKIEKTKLGNGVMLVNIIAPDFPLSIVSAWFRAGSRYDPIGKEGLAHFFEHVLLTRTEKTPNRQDLLARTAKLGIYFNAFTSVETAHYHCTQLPEHTYEALDILLEGLSFPVIEESDINREKSIILDEESRNRNNPQDYLWRLRNKALWPEDRVSHGFYGNKESINSISLSDINNFKDQYYTANNCTFVVIGSENIEKLKERIEKGLVLPNAPLQEQKEQVTASTNLTEIRDTEDITVGIYYPTVSIQEEKETKTLALLKEYLADHFISRLISRLRVESDYTYWVDGDSDHFSDRGFIGFNFTCNPSRLDSALKIVDEEIDKIKSGNMPSELLASIKEAHISRVVRNSLWPNYLLSWYGWPACLGGKISTITEYLDDIRKVSALDLEQAAKKYLIAENRALVKIGRN
jgi:predicted Zn-dependent peptidase